MYTLHNLVLLPSRWWVYLLMAHITREVEKGEGKGKVQDRSLKPWSSCIVTMTSGSDIP